MVLKVIFIGIIVIIAIAGCYFAQRAITLWERRINLDEYALNLEQDPVKSRELLANMVEDAIVMWSVYNVRTEDESYITSAKMEECLIWVIEHIIRQCTPTIIDKLSIAYIIDEDDDMSLINVIKDVAKLHVMQYVLQQNAKDMTDDVPNVHIQV